MRKKTRKSRSLTTAKKFSFQKKSKRGRHFIPCEVEIRVSERNLSKTKEGLPKMRDLSKKNRQSFISYVANNIQVKSSDLAEVCPLSSRQIGQIKRGIYNRTPEVVPNHRLKQWAL